MMQCRTHCDVMKGATLIKPKQHLVRAPRWYAVQVQPRRESLAVFHLSRQGFETFSPLIKRPARRSGRIVSRREALFPGYLFARFDKRQDAWRSINGTIGVSRLVMFGDEPCALPKDFVDTLKASTDDEDCVAFDTALTQGSKVRIVGGVLDNLTGMLVKADSQARVTILLDLLSGPRRVSISRNRLVAED